MTRASISCWAGVLTLAFLLAGCGQRPLDVPQVVRPAAPAGFNQVTYGGAGVRLATPRSWTTTPETPPLLTVISSGGAVISLWRYARPGSLPSSNAQLGRAYKRLIAAALRRQPKLHVIDARVGSLDGHPSVELDATEPIGAAQQRVRSLHVFTRASEVVLEEYAPLDALGRVDQPVFEHVWRSLVVPGR